MHPVMRIAILLGLSPALAIGGGELTPPGPPGVTMKTLQEIEPRIPISSLPINISSPGSYYFTTNLVSTTNNVGINLITDNVIMDMNGFELVGFPGSASGIQCVHVKNIHIRNGTIRDWGSWGIYGFDADDCVLENMNIIDNGYDGVWLGDRSLAESCVFSENGWGGLKVEEGACIVECTSGANGTAGFILGRGSLLQRCTIHENGDAGVQVQDEATIKNCSISETKGSGLHVTGTRNRIENNHITGAATGLTIEAEGNTVVNNSVLGNTVNFNIVPGNSPNILLCEIPETIPWPATVRLAASLKGRPGEDGITISSSHVSIDLDGHALLGNGGDSGIVFSDMDPDVSDVRIFNGVIAGWDEYGVNAFFGKGCSLHQITLSSNGFDGVRMGTGGTVRDCVSFYNGGSGIATVHGVGVYDCVTSGNGKDGIQAIGGGALIRGCVAYECTQYGINAGGECTIESCTVQECKKAGIFAESATLITGCTVTDIEGDCIQVEDRCTVQNNLCRSGGQGLADGAGIHVKGQQNRVDGNHATVCDRGLEVSGTDNFIVRNTVSGNSTNFVITGGNSVGEIKSLVGGGIIKDPVNAWANFEF